MGHGLRECMKRLISGKRAAIAKRKTTSSNRPLPFDTVRKDSRTKRLVAQPTIRLRPEDLEEAELRRDLPKEPMPRQFHQLQWFGLTDTGRVRDHNEDSYFCAAKEDTGLFAVADGMGGHEAGEVASRIAVEAVCTGLLEDAPKQDDPVELLRRTVDRANRSVTNEADARGTDMGTTLNVAFVAENRVIIANVGDSRAYWIENGSIRQVSEDHSLVARLVAAGKITKDEARVHPKSNLLFRTLGTRGKLSVDTFEIELRKNGSLLLCTDGLWNEVTDEEIHSICAGAPDAQAACAELVARANRNGGKDNITVVVVRAI